MKATVFSLFFAIVVSAFPHNVAAAPERQRLGDYDLPRSPGTKKRSVYVVPMQRQRTLDRIGHQPIPLKRQTLGK